MAFFSEIDLASYQILLYAPVVLMYVVYMIVLLPCIVVYKIRSKKSQKKEKIPAAWRALIDITLIGGLKTKTAEDGTKQFYLFGHQVTTKYVRIFGTHIIGLRLSVLVTFWLNFIIKITENCNNAIDCFFGNGSRIDDCNYIDRFDDPIQCYEIELDIINAAGRVGGLIAINTALLYGLLAAQLWLRKKIPRSRSQQKRICLTSLFVLLRVIPIVVLLILFALSIFKFWESISNQRFVAVPQYINTVLYLTPLLVLSLQSLSKKVHTSDTRRTVQTQIIIFVLMIEREHTRFCKKQNARLVF